MQLKAPQNHDIQVHDDCLLTSGHNCIWKAAARPQMGHIRQNYNKYDTMSDITQKVELGRGELQSGLHIHSQAKLQYIVQHISYLPIRCLKGSQTSRLQLGLQLIS